MLKKKYLLLYTWIVSVVAMIGSLYFSEIMYFVPCELCWYQRILMYPLVVILGIASFKKDFNSLIYTLPLSVMGMIVSSYHYYLQQFAPKNSTGLCQAGCSGKYIDWFGFITIPFLALIAFTIISILSVIIIRKNKA
jgi:disulfide bond formation protein DsbB